jgi:oligopeptide/dipeptide ABC transporter ATP-binding protein
MSNGDKTISKEPLIITRHLKKYFNVKRRGTLHAVDDVSFEVYPGETMALVGESGCGKSTVGNVIMRLLSPTGGALTYRGIDVFKAKDEQSMELRKKMQMIFQDPFSSLNPRKTIYKILAEAYETHKYGSREEIKKAVGETCEKVQFPKSLLHHYPHELDGGMRQVVGIARALSLNPDFIVCDEPVSALDVSIQARIINLLMDLQKDMGIAYLFISHDLSIVRHISKKVAVMYLGQIVEVADTAEMFRNTMHPYSIALLSAVPKINVGKKTSRIVLKGDVPSPMNPKPGCRFAPRCWMAHENCVKEDPVLNEVFSGHRVACHYATESIARSKLIQS